jgi:DNA-directed RNA polymerase sigma subunit (sigma70/sigma32)
MKKQIQKYCNNKPLLNLNDRHTAIFEYRYGVIDGIRHTQKVTGKKFNISDTRVAQIEAKIWYRLTLI